MIRLTTMTFVLVASTTFAKDVTGPCVPVYVTSAGARGGFTDPSKGSQDSMKDLRGAIADKRSLCLVEDREKARIVLEVQSRETAQMTASPIGRMRDRTVQVKFIFGDFETEMSGSAMGGSIGSGGAWKKASGKIAKQVEQWVVANRAKIDAVGK